MPDAKTKARVAAYHAAHRAEILARQRARREALTVEQLNARREANRAWKAANPEKVKASRDRRAAAHRQAARAYYRAHADVYRERARVRYAADPEAWQARHVEWRHTNPDKAAALSAAAAHKRRARKQANGGNLTAADVKALRQSADGLCAYCLKPCAKLVVEHCVPLSRGGSNTIDNCVMACQNCNSRKHDKTPLEFLCNLPRLGRFDGNHPIQPD